MIGSFGVIFWGMIYKFFDNIDDVLQEAQNLQNEVYNEKEDIYRVVDNYSHSNSNLIRGLINDIISLEVW